MFLERHGIFRGKGHLFYSSFTCGNRSLHIIQRFRLFVGAFANQMYHTIRYIRKTAFKVVIKLLGIQLLCDFVVIVNPEIVKAESQIAGDGTEH